jgi:ubiquinone/menaquinone biosynthesis C-methylase UbiE
MEPAMNDTIPNKIEKEKQFHNERFSQVIDPRAHLNKWYASVRHGAEKQDKLVLELAKNKKVLEYGCADGGLSLFRLKLPEQCESLTGIDISDVAIGKANERVASAGYKNTRFLTMNAEILEFPDGIFDLVFGRGIIHHLDLHKSFSEVSRVLRKNGTAVFSEPLGHNPLLNWYRNKTPDMRTQDEHPLRMADFNIARQYFPRVDIVFFGLFSVASVLIDPTVEGKLYRLAKAIDDIVLRIPILGRFAWHCLIICHKT